MGDTSKWYEFYSDITSVMCHEWMSTVEIIHECRESYDYVFYRLSELERMGYVERVKLSPRRTLWRLRPEVKPPQRETKTEAVNPHCEELDARILTIIGYYEPCPTYEVVSQYLGRDGFKDWQIEPVKQSLERLRRRGKIRKTGWRWELI